MTWLFPRTILPVSKKLGRGMDVYTALDSLRGQLERRVGCWCKKDRLTTRLSPFQVNSRNHLGWNLACSAAALTSNEGKREVDQPVPRDVDLEMKGNIKKQNKDTPPQLGRSMWLDSATPFIAWPVIRKSTFSNSPKVADRLIGRSLIMRPAETCSLKRKT